MEDDKVSQPIVLHISGILGRMGQFVYGLGSKDPAFELVHGFDIAQPPDLVHGNHTYPPAEMGAVFRDPTRKPDVLLIFIKDTVAAVEQTKLAAQYGIWVVIGTTGFSASQLAELRDLASRTAILVASNFSLGVTLMAKLTAVMASTLPASYEPGIYEEHHRAKTDAPSGTAKMLAEVIETVRGLVMNQVSSFRGGNIAGIHKVTFAGQHETLRFEHEAGSPVVFAEGAILAVKWIAEREVPGWYTMNQVLGL